MSRYIDADNLLPEIERLIGVHTSKRGQDEVAMNLSYIKEFTESLQQEQPSLPSNLNEAAIQFAQRAYSPFDDPYEVSRAFQNDVNCFKAGAEWMARQGYTQEGIAHLDDCEVWVDMKNTDIKDGDKVIVQIRKNGQ